MLAHNKNIVRRFRAALVFLLFPVVVLMGSFSLTSLAHGAEIVPEITNVVLNPEKPMVGSEVRMSLDWKLPLTAKSGDSFQIQLPEQFKFSSVVGKIVDRDFPSKSFMTVKGNDNAVATFTVTDYAEQRMNETGKEPYGDFSVWFQISSQAEGDKDYDILLPSDGVPVNKVTVTVIPADNSPEDAFADKYREAKKAGPSQYSPAGQQFYWEMTTPIGNAEVTLVDDLTDEKNTPGQEFICDADQMVVKYYSAPEEWTFPPKYKDGEYSQGQAQPVITDVPEENQEISCTTTKLTAKFVDIPENSVVYLRIPVKVDEPEDAEIKVFTNFLTVEPYGKPIIRTEGKGYYKADTPDEASPEEKFANENAKPHKTGMVSTDFDSDSTPTQTVKWTITTGIGLKSATITDEFDNSKVKEDGKAMYFTCNTLRAFVKSVVDGKVRSVNITENSDLFKNTCTGTKLVATFKDLEPNEVGEIRIESVANKGFYWNTADIATDKGNETASTTVSLSYGSAGSGVIDPNDGDTPPLTPGDDGGDGDGDTPPLTPGDDGDDGEGDAPQADPKKPAEESTNKKPQAKKALPTTGAAASNNLLLVGFVVSAAALIARHHKAD